MDRRIIITVGETEFAALQSAAKREFRPVRDQARFMLNQALQQAAQASAQSASKGSCHVQPTAG